MQIKTDEHIMHGLTFDQAIDYAINHIPGLKHDFELMAKKRKDGARDMQGIGRIGLSIPDPLYGLVVAYHPDLENPDYDIQHNAWLKFMRHPHSERFRINSKL